ncbi:MAG: PaaI family thioesterase [Candidatus Thorarchaeota archaeon]
MESIYILSESVKSRLQSVVDGSGAPPIASLVGFKLISFEYGKAKFTMHADQRHHNPGGILHGGILCDITDAAMGVAFATTLEENQRFATINLQINYLKAIIEDDLIAEGYLIKKGKSIGFLEAKVYDSTNNLVATASSSCKII